MKKKIAVIGLKGLPAFGGAATVGENIIEQLKKKYEFTVYSVASHTDLKTGKLDGFKQIVFKTFFKGGINTLVYYIKSALHCMFQDYDLIHLHHRDAAFILLLLRIKYKTVVTTHGVRCNAIDKWKKYAWFFRLQQKFFLKSSNKVICVSKNSQRILRDNYDVYAEYIPNGVNLIDLNEKKDEDYILFAAGRITSIKGLDVLLRAYSYLKLNKRLYILGDFKYDESYWNKIEKWEENENIRFFGLIKSKKKLFHIVKNASLFIFPSLKESMSMMLLEVASCKTPIICSDIIENRDIFDENEVIFFKSGDYKDLALKIKHSLTNIRSIDNKAFRAYKKVLNKYLWKEIATKYDKVYTSLSE